VTEPASLVPQRCSGVEVVFHVAAVADYWRSDPSRLMRVNVDGTRNVLRAAREAGVRRVVFTSSCAALGQPPFGQALDERAQFNLRAQKHFLMATASTWQSRFARSSSRAGLDVVIVNPAVVFGPRDVNMVSSSLVVEAARRGLPFAPPGGVSAIDVADVCAGHIAAAERGRTGERYILTAENLTYAQLFALLAEVVGRPCPRVILPRWVFWLAAPAVGFARGRLGLRLPVSQRASAFRGRDLLVRCRQGPPRSGADARAGARGDPAHV
jgi:dihydroflavonol-4-reductase